jgi:UDP-N-acetylglucosamine--N-acetylmuramyl-(pentapeptide) pyrophosphoryl-undecaprenol N-acetylglucosamine transferase
VYPALAIGEIAAGRFPGARFLFVGTRRGAESGIVPSRGMDIAYISIESFRRSAASAALFGAVLARASVQARRILARFDPDLVIASGGYAGAPVLIAAAARRTLGGGRPKIFVHEQNVVAGLANRLGGRLADRVGTTFPESNRYFPGRKASCVGYPLRAQIAAGGRDEARRRLGIDAGAFVVFAFGGSSGSRTINRAVVDALPVLLAHEDVRVIHAVGRYRGADYDPAGDTQARLDRTPLDAGRLGRYSRLDYTEEIGTYYGAADVVVSRCGSGTLFELRKAKKPSVLLPKMGSAGEHQLHNALAVERRGLALVIRERRDPDEAGGVMKVEGRELAEKILDLKTRPEKIRAMVESSERDPIPDSARLIGDILEELAGSRGR